MCKHTHIDTHPHTHLSLPSSVHHEKLSQKPHSVPHVIVQVILGDVENILAQQGGLWGEVCGCGGREGRGGGGRREEFSFNFHPVPTSILNPAHLLWVCNQELGSQIHNLEFHNIILQRWAWFTTVGGADQRNK